MQTFWIRREQLRLDEFGPTQWSSLHVALPTWRLGMAFTYSELGREGDARRELDQVQTEDLVGGRKDLTWLLTAAQLSEVCAYLDDPRPRRALYELLIPYASRCLIAGRGAICLGSMAQRLGLLCAVMSRREEGEAHFEAALDRNTRIGARPWLAHTQRQYAGMLLSRGRATTARRRRTCSRTPSTSGASLG
jgi:hypothetical protein